MAAVINSTISFMSWLRALFTYENAPKTEERPLLPSNLDPDRYSEVSFPDQALADASRQIRLFSMNRTAEGKIHGTIKTFELDHSPDYVALSYTWGRHRVLKTDISGGVHADEGGEGFATGS